MQETDRNNKVMHYHTKDALRKAFNTVSANGAASEYIDFIMMNSRTGYMSSRLRHRHGFMKKRTMI